MILFRYQYKKLDGVSFIVDETGKITGYTTNTGGADSVFPFKKESNKYLTSASHGTQSKDASVTATLNIDKQSIGDEGYLVVTGANKQSTNAVNKPTLTDLEIIETIVSDNTGGGFPSMYYYRVKVIGDNPKVVASTISNDYKIIVYIIAHF